MEERRKDWPEIIERFHQSEERSIRTDAAIKEINLALGRIVSDIESEKETRARVNREFFRQVAELKRLIVGNGEPGLSGKIGRLEEKEKDRTAKEEKKSAFLLSNLVPLWAAAVGFVFKLIYDSFKGAKS